MQAVRCAAAIAASCAGARAASICTTRRAASTIARWHGMASAGAGGVAAAHPTRLAVVAAARTTAVTLPTRWHPRRCLFVKVEPTPNPDSMKFLPEDKVVLPEQFGNGMVRTVTTA